jgi:predicted TIM-barrel fold metal-dependent hydrolase
MPPSQGVSNDHQPDTRLRALKTSTRRDVGRQLLAGSTVLGACLRAEPGMALPSRQTPVRVDHHVHVNSPAILAFLPQFCASIARFGKCDAAFTAPLTVSDLLRQMDDAGVERALVLSTAYLAESPMMAAPAGDHARLVRSANDFTVGLAKRFPRRIGAFVSVHPLSETALPEISRWRGNGHVCGLKLHLTSSMVDLRSRDNLQRLAAVVGAASENGFPVVVHLRTVDPRYGAEDVRNFVETVVPAANGSPIQVAHAGGWGGLDANTIAALSAFADAFENNPALSKTIWFDLADVWRADTPASDKTALVALIRRIGLDRFVPASDWPFPGNLNHYYSVIYPELPLSAEEWTTIRRNAPAYARARTRG